MSLLLRANVYGLSIETSILGKYNGEVKTIEDDGKIE